MRVRVRVRGVRVRVRVTGVRVRVRAAAHPLPLHPLHHVRGGAPLTLTPLTPCKGREGPLTLTPLTPCKGAVPQPLPNPGTYCNTCGVSIYLSSLNNIYSSLLCVNDINDMSRVLGVPKYVVNTLTTSQQWYELK